MRKETETDLVRNCLELLRLRGCFCWRNNTGGLAVGKRFVHFGQAGSADILGIVGPGGTPKAGRLIACECKVGRNKLTEAQSLFLATISDHGGYAWCVRSLKDLEELLDESGI